MDAMPSYLDQLLAQGVLHASGVEGLYGRSGEFNAVIERLSLFFDRWGEGRNVETLRFPPMMRRADLVRNGYFKTFPQLAGTIHAFCGNEHAHRDMLRCIEAGEDWTKQQDATDMVLTPAACYPLYPMIARRGRLPEDGLLINVRSWCFRHEPSSDPGRLQSFQMQEYVRIGSPTQVVAFRDGWMEYGQQLAGRLGLPCTADVANDPFFGRAGKVLADSQRDQRLKFELLIPITGTDRPTACMSFNYHMDHFGLTWGIQTSDGEVAHTACVGFGLERLTLALFRHHGLTIESWPDSVRAVLWGEG